MEEFSDEPTRAEFDEPGLDHSLASAEEDGSRVEQILSLPDASMLRAVRLSRVLRCGGHLLSSSEGSEATYRLSQPVARIDAFVSHNWDTPRWLKFLALALHFNGGSATLAAVAALCLCAALTVAGFGPIIDGDTPMALLALPCTLPTFFAVLLFRSDLSALLGCRGRMVFLDKACIDQRSDVAKERGIRSLAAFLGKSSSMVVCCTELYLQRLWTVYELATYIQVRSGEADPRVHVLPIGLSACMTACSVVLFLTLAVVRALMWVKVGHPSLIGVMMTAITSFGFTKPLRMWARHQSRAQAAFASFSIKNAHCSREEDRALVIANSIALLKGYGFTTHDASEEEALAAFDSLVRSTILETFTASLGRTGYPYRQLLPLILAYLSGLADVVAGTERVRAHNRSELPATPLLVATTVTSACGTLPLVVGLMLMLSRRHLDLSGLRELAYCCCIAATAIFAILCDPWRGAASLLVPLARTSPVALAGLFVWCATLLAAAAWLFRPTLAPKGSAPAAARRPRSAMVPGRRLPGESVSEESDPEKRMQEGSFGSQCHPQHDPESLFIVCKGGELVAL